jgi:hypothetical protein
MSLAVWKSDLCEALACDSRSHITGEGEKHVYACAKCGGTDLSVKTGLFYWDAVMDLVEDEPEEFADKAENCVNEFFAFGRCIACGEEAEMAGYSKL